MWVLKFITRLSDLLSTVWIVKYIVLLDLFIFYLFIAVGNSPKAKKNEDADFDTFAQSRTATYESTKSR